MRAIPPIVFFVTAAVVQYLNTSGRDRVILFPMMDTLFPSTAGDLAAQGQASVYVLLGMGVLTSIFAVYAMVQQRRLDAEE